MSDYRLDITGNVNLSDYSNIHDYIGLVDPDDNFIITLDSVTPSHVELIMRMLSNGGFEVATKGPSYDSKYVISAHRKSQQ